MNGKRAADRALGQEEVMMRRRMSPLEETEQKKQGTASASTPCAACKLLRRRCAPECVFAPHFPAGQPQKFADVHKVFGASNVSKLLQEISVEQRGDAAGSLVYEAKARIRDPVYGCVGAICSLQRQVVFLQAELAVARAKAFHFRTSHGDRAPGADVVPSRAATDIVAAGSSSISSLKPSSPERKEMVEPLRRKEWRWWSRLR